mmetsp:Transcript_69539/g.190869  ORF Transcript_69539/g.190869 Transcript_69539/m.190869 type:complete len:201 (-) Transcript_69539:249-851(-)|eukprot:2226111-Prymnesium_polylepis.2
MTLATRSAVFIESAGPLSTTSRIVPVGRRAIEASIEAVPFIEESAPCVSTMSNIESIRRSTWVRSSEWMRVSGSSSVHSVMRQGLERVPAAMCCTAESLGPYTRSATRMMTTRTLLASPNATHSFSALMNAFCVGVNVDSAGSCGAAVGICVDSSVTVAIRPSPFARAASVLKRLPKRTSSVSAVGSARGPTGGMSTMMC